MKKLHTIPNHRNASLDHVLNFLGLLPYEKFPGRTLILRVDRLRFLGSTDISCEEYSAFCFQNTCGPPYSIQRNIPLFFAECHGFPIVLLP